MHEEYEIEDDDPDVCHHGRGFDEDCEDCEDEIEAARIQESADRRSGGA